jgi:hypothetical protein
MQLVGHQPCIESTLDCKRTQSSGDLTLRNFFFDKARKHEILEYVNARGRQHITASLQCYLEMH